MLQLISSKNDNGIYTLARKNKPKEFGNFLDLEMDDCITSAENISIFGDKNAYLVKASRQEDLERIDAQLVEILEKSEHFFVIVGSGAEFEKKCAKVKLKPIKVEEKKVFDFPSDLVAALQKHDKKNSWSLLLQELSKKDAEPTHGVCVFAYKSLLVYLNDTNKNSPDSGVKDFSWRQAATNGRLGKREREEVVDKYFKLILAYHHARIGKGDLAKQLESWVLEN